MNSPSHAALCAFLGIPATEPAPWWTPYAVQATQIVIRCRGESARYGGAHTCGTCGLGIDMLEGNYQGKDVDARDVCPKCGATSLPEVAP